MNRCWNCGDYVDENGKGCLCSNLRARIAALEAELEAYRTELSKEMPHDFKDWWQNSRSEWPLVARLVLEGRRERIAALEAENANLKAWKESALEVEKSWDAQAVAKLLGIKWGHDIRKHIQPKIEELKAEIDRLRYMLFG